MYNTNLYGNWPNQQQQQQQQQNQWGGKPMNQNMQTGFNQQTNLDPRRQRELQIQDLKKNYPSLTHQRHTNTPSPVDIIEMTLPVKNMQIPLSLLLDESYPATHPRILIRGRMKHNLFEEGPNGIELQVTNFMQWDPKYTLTYTLQALKNFFEKDPPQREKIIEEVETLLACVNEQDFKSLVTTDANTYFKSKDTNELKGYAQAVSYQEIIAASQEYQKIAKNLLEVAAFNEKIAGEVMQKVDALNKRKQNASEMAQRIEQLKQEFMQTQSQCKSVSDRFNLQEVGRAVEEELMKLEKLSNDLEETAYSGSQGTGSVEESIQVYFENRKKYHRFNIIREKLPSISPN